MKKLGIAMDFKAKMITIDDITLPVKSSTICKKCQHTPHAKAN
jgi:hypothetical protein